MTLKLLLPAVLVILIPASAHAYVGPGAGLGAILGAAAILFALLFLIIGFLWFPIKRILKKRRANKKGPPHNTDTMP